MSSTRVTAPPTGAPRQRRTGVRRWLRWRYLPIVILLLLTPIFWSVGHALTAPGTDSVSARLAEWGRDHHAGWLVTWLERISYKPPKVGGSPPANSPLLHVPQAQTVTHSHPHTHVVRVLPPPITPPASPPLPGEGHWRVLARKNGVPAMAVAYVRPDAQHTSYTAAVVWINQHLTRIAYHPGYQEPGGGPWPATDSLTHAQRPGLIAAFNSAFRLQDSRGGFYGWGKTVSPLQPGAASVALSNTGTIHIGAWGREVGMTPQTQIVRQNLVEIVDHGTPAKGLASNAGDQWGATLGNVYYVWRSGIGQTRNGDLMYVTGDRLSVPTLANLMVRAGVVRGMELDINPEWTSYVMYRTPTGAPNERNLLPDMQQPAGRYDVSSSRDFFAVYLK